MIGAFSRLVSAWQGLREADRAYAQKRRLLTATRTVAAHLKKNPEWLSAPVHVIKEEPKMSKNVIQVVPTSNGFIVSIVGQSTDFMVVVESRGRNADDVVKALGTACADLAEKAVPGAAPAQPAPAQPVPAAAPAVIPGQPQGPQAL